MSSRAVPVLWVLMVAVVALVLILVVTLRPWAGPDASADTLLNYGLYPPEGYGRSPLAWVDAEAETGLAWHPSPRASVDDPFSLFVGYGCASCHGLDASGGAVGDDLSEVSPSEVRKALRKGPEGMPKYPLPDEVKEALVEFLTGRPSPTPAAATAPKPTPSPSPAPTSTATPSPSPPVAVEASPSPTATPSPTPEPQGPPVVQAAEAVITVDGDVSDWADVPPATVRLQQIKPIPGVDIGPLDPIEVQVRVAVDDQRIYFLMEVPDDFDYDPADRGLSAAMAVMFRIDEPAAPHMGATEEEQKKSLGKVDIWHWKLDCGPGQTAGGGPEGIPGGNDPDCNLDDEWAETPKDLEDDGTRQAENSLVGVWEHTARDQGTGAFGTWIFEMSRKLQTGDPDDAQFRRGDSAYMALAYWDPDETPDGWTSEGHLQSSSDGWIEVRLP